MLKRTIGCLLLVSGQGLTGCSTAPTEPRSASNGTAPAPAESGRSYSEPRGESRRASRDLAAPRRRGPEGAGRAEAAAEERPSSAHSGAWDVAPEPSSRPGLATRWGETHSSRVSSAPFERNSEFSPLLSARLFYNDADGIRAMRGGREFGALGHSQWNGARGALAVRIVSEHGRSFPAFRRGSDVYVTGQEGQRYLIEITNHTGSRFEAVATVDGLDVIDGESGSFDKRGYLVGPWATVQIDGFRQSEAEVAAFRFGGVGESYAASKGDDRNVGVIGVAFFDEVGSRVPAEELERRERAQPFPGQFAQPPLAY